LRRLGPRRLHGARAALLALSCLALAACGETRQDVTALVVRVESDLTVDTDIDEIAVNQLDRRLAAPGDVPLTVAFTPSGSADQPVTITATGRLAGHDVVSQSFTTSFLPGQVALLVMRLDRACLPARVTCTGDLTCEAGSCVPRSRPPSPYPLPDGGADAADGTDGGHDAVTSTDAVTGTDAVAGADAADGGPAPDAAADARDAAADVTDAGAADGAADAGVDMLFRCGNGVLDPGETCDTGGESATCNSDCTAAKCGDGKLNAAAGETCELPNGGVADTATCNGKSAPAGVACHAPACGDGYVNPAAGETCDTGGADTAACNGSAAPAGARCRATRCGDGYVNPAAGETCDDGNNSACGTCNATCAVLQTAAPATGTINAIPASQLVSGETFTISDGIHAPVVFEFTQGSATTPGHVAISTTGLTTATLVAMKIVAAIDANGVAVASVDTAVPSRVDVVASRPGVAGNVPITETVSSPMFQVMGMSGGVGYDCAAGVGCAVDADCLSGTCTSHLCQ
jgi:cysteine-rich repeat protein